MLLRRLPPNEQAFCLTPTAPSVWTVSGKVEAMTRLDGHPAFGNIALCQDSHSADAIKR